MLYVIFFVLFYIAGGAFTVYCVNNSDSHMAEREKVGLFLCWPIVWAIGLILHIMDWID